MAFWKEDASFEDKALALIPRFMRDLSIGPMDSSVIVGNLGHESNEFKTLQEISPTVAGSRGGYGWPQWTGPRRRAFEKWAADRGLSVSSHEANYGFLIHELTNTWEKKAIPAIKAATTLEAKTLTFMREFERPGIEHADNRVALARRAYAAYVNSDRPTVPETVPPPVGGPATGIAGGSGMLATAAQTANDVLWWIGLIVTVGSFLWLLWRFGILQKLGRRIFKRRK